MQSIIFQCMRIKIKGNNKFWAPKLKEKKPRFPIFAIKLVLYQNLILLLPYKSDIKNSHVFVIFPSFYITVQKILIVIGISKRHYKMSTRFQST